MKNSDTHRDRQTRTHTHTETQTETHRHTGRQTDRHNKKQEHMRHSVSRDESANHHVCIMKARAMATACHSGTSKMIGLHRNVDAKASLIESRSIHHSPISPQHSWNSTAMLLECQLSSMDTVQPQPFPKHVVENRHCLRLGYEYPRQGRWRSTVPVSACAQLGFPRPPELLPSCDASHNATKCIAQYTTNSNCAARARPRPRTHEIR